MIMSMPSPKDGSPRLPFLVYFARDLGSAALDEFESLARDAGVADASAQLSRGGGWRAENARVEASPAFVVRLPLAAAQHIAARAVMVRMMLELWAWSDTHSAGGDRGEHGAAEAGEGSAPAVATAAAALRACVEAAQRLDGGGDCGSGVNDDGGLSRYALELVRARRAAAFAPGRAWRLQVEAFGRHVPPAAQAAARRVCAPAVPAQGPVRLADADCDVTFCAVLDFEHAPASTRIPALAPAPQAAVAGAPASALGGAAAASNSAEAAEATEADAELCRTLAALPVPRRAFLGVRLPPGRRGLVNALDLKRRAYLGPTSLDAQLALLMCRSAEPPPHRASFCRAAPPASCLATPPVSPTCR